MSAGPVCATKKRLKTKLDQTGSCSCMPFEIERIGPMDWFQPVVHMILKMDQNCMSYGQKNIVLAKSNFV